MRGHWISTTRKLNRHYQSGGSILYTWNASQVNADHTIAWGVDELLQGMFITAAPPYAGSAAHPMPAGMQNAAAFEFIPIIRRENGNTGDIFLPYIRITVITEDAQGNATTTLFNWYCPNAQPSPSGQWIPYTPLTEEAFTNLYNNAGLAPLYGEKFVYNSVQGIYTPTTQFIIRKSAIQNAARFVSFDVSAGLIQSERLTSSELVYLSGEIRKV